MNSKPASPWPTMWKARATDAEITFAAETSSHLSVVDGASQNLRVAEGKEQSTTVRIRVKDELGSAELKLKASCNGQETQRHATLSVRPAVPFMTEVRSGNFKGGNVDVPVQRESLPGISKTERHCVGRSVRPGPRTRPVPAGVPPRLQRTAHAARPSAGCSWLTKQTSV